MADGIRYVEKLDPWSSHAVIGGWLGECAHGTRVLDVGTAAGVVGRLCQGRGLALRGVEPCAEFAELARPYYQALATAVLADTADDFLQGHAVVVCADVLEHMADPAGALARLVNLQPGGALFIVSVPNVANLWVRLALLFGRFDYAERGILDRTHLRFFTRRTFVDLLRGAGLEGLRIIATPVPLNLVHPFFDRTAPGRWLHGLLARVTRVFPTLLGYQFVARAYKP